MITIICIIATVIAIALVLRICDNKETNEVSPKEKHLV